MTGIKKCFISICTGLVVWVILSFLFLKGLQWGSTLIFIAAYTMGYWLTNFIKGIVEK